MIRFRFQEDERRFILLHSEMFEKLARAGLSEVVGSNTLRNVGKIEQMAYMEGIRQGLAMSTIASAMIQEETGLAHEPPPFQPIAQKAFQLHALIYGSKDTPLRDVEKEWLGKLNLDEDHLAHSWLDDKPMRFAPATLRELEGNSPPVAPMMSVQAAHKPTPVPKPFEMGETFHNGETVMPDINAILPPPEAMHGAEVTVPEPWQKGEYEPDDDPLDLVEAEVATEEAEEKANQPESPEFLDVVRDAIQTMKRGGWDPKTWNDIVLGLHRHMSVDAGFLDIQLTTHVGRTVLDQCGLAGMAPPEMMSFEFLNEPPAAETAAAPSSMGDADGGTIGFGKAHGWDDER
jgi:hypothetical protein